MYLLGKAGMPKAEMKCQHFAWGCEARGLFYIYFIYDLNGILFTYFFSPATTICNKNLIFGYSHLYTQETGQKPHTHASRNVLSLFIVLRIAQGNRIARADGTEDSLNKIIYSRFKQYIFF